MLIYSVVLLSLSLSFISSKKERTLLTLADHTVLGKEKDTHTHTHTPHPTLILREHSPGLSTAASRLPPEGMDSSAFAPWDLSPPLPWILLIGFDFMSNMFAGAC